MYYKILLSSELCHSSNLNYHNTLQITKMGIKKKWMLYNQTIKQEEALLTIRDLEIHFI